MITTKGVIEQVIKDRDTGVIQYRVRMPLFHEVEGSSEVKTNELPLAIYPLPPHMENTELRIGDVVECTLEDGGLDTVVILGLIPSSQTKNTAGSMQTESKIAVYNISSASFDPKGSADLPSQIKIRLNDEDEELIDREEYERNFINIDDLRCIKGLTTPLTVQLDRINEILTYLEDNLLDLEVRVEPISKGVES